MCLFANHCSSNAHIMVLPKLIFVLLCSWFISPLAHRWRFAVAPLHGFVKDLVIALIAEVLNTLLFCLKCSVKCYTTLKMKRNHPFAFSLWLTDLGGAHCHKWIFCVSIYVVARRDTFHILLCLKCCATGQAYINTKHVNFLFINECGTCKNNICGHSFFWSGTCEFTNIISVTKKSL